MDIRCGIFEDRISTCGDKQRTIENLQLLPLGFQILRHFLLTTQKTISFIPQNIALDTGKPGGSEDRAQLSIWRTILFGKPSPIQSYSQKESSLGSRSKSILSSLSRFPLSRTLFGTSGVGEGDEILGRNPAHVDVAISTGEAAILRAHLHSYARKKI